MYRLEVENLGKKFDLFRNKKSFFKRFSEIFIKKDEDFFWAFKNISFKLKKGEILGVIGRNGAGKTTLLKTISGIYDLDAGKIIKKGKVICLTETRNGLKNRLTMRENIFFLGMVLGLSRKEIEENFSKIVEFSGLKEYLDVELYKFSSGMISRLAFSILIYCLGHSRPDILLLDEVFFSGGDIDFQKKSLGKMKELVNSGSSVILVSHNLETIKENCDRALWLEKGILRMWGDVNKVINSYKNYSPENSPSVVLVYSMGKVASISFYRSIMNCSTYPVFHCHNLNPRLYHYSNIYNENLKILKNIEGKKKIKIVSIFREPVSRNISAFLGNKFGKIKDANKIFKEFLEEYKHQIPLDWFDEQLKEVFGIDVYSEKFPKEKGYKIYKKGNVEVLLLKYEKIKENINAIESFLEVKNFKLENLNLSKEKRYGDIYKHLLKKSKFPKSYLNKMYNSRFVNHFYTNNEIDGFRKEWLTQ